MTEASFQNISIPVHGEEQIHARLYGVGDDLNWGISLKGSSVKEDLTTPLTLAFHDFPGKDMMAHNALFDRFARQAAVKGMPTLLIDFRGCGNSRGKEHNLTLKTATEDIAAVIAWAKESFEFSRFLFLSAGFGALPILNWFHQSPPSIKKSIMAFMMLWPHIDPKRVTFLAQMQYLKERQASEGETLALGAHDLDIALHDQIMAMDIEEALNTITQPILCFYGSDDEYSSPKQADIIRNLKNPEFIDLQVFHGAGNGLTEEKIRPHVLRHLQDFLIKFA